MKIRTDFVTNSSSSSFICVAKIDKSDELLSYFKEEYGKYGVRLLENYLMTGKEIKESSEWRHEEFIEYLDDKDTQISDDDWFLSATFISYTDEGDTEGDDAWLYNHIPDEYKEEVYEGESE